MDGDEADRTDGLRVSWRDLRSWLHVRPSGTEPIVRIIAEAPEQSEAEELIDRVVKALERMT